MPQSCRVLLLPDYAEPASFLAETVVVVDILRATTTIVHALAAGAIDVVPLLTIEEAQQAAAQAAGPVVLGGERGGIKIAGFDLGNSPAEYTTAAVGGKRLIFTTTNGTRAMQCCHQAQRVLMGSFANFSATCRELAASDRVTVLCAGTDGHITREDVLFAGAIAEDLVLSRGASIANDEAAIALDAWQFLVRDIRSSARPLAEFLRASVGGRNLMEIGQERDIEIAARLDLFDFAAELLLPSWRIVRR